MPCGALLPANHHITHQIRTDIDWATQDSLTDKAMQNNTETLTQVYQTSSTGFGDLHATQAYSTDLTGEKCSTTAGNRDTAVETPRLGT